MEDQAEGRIMVRTVVLAGATLLALASAVSACPFDQNAQTTTDQTTATSQLPLPADGSNGGTTDKETKTGG
jgi:hypothetical protein